MSDARPVFDGPAPSILVVDDTIANLQLLGGMLKEHGYRVRPVPSGPLALQAAHRDPPDLILLDITMPEMNGYEVCARLKADPQLSGIPVVFISALGETMDKVKAFAIGGVDYVTKPFQCDEVRARVATHLSVRRLQRELEAHNRDLNERVQEQVREISESQMATIHALAKLAESRDDATGRHIERVQEFCRLLAESLSRMSRYRNVIGPEFIANVHHAGPLHDIGKVAIPDRILLCPGKLSADDLAVMRSHAVRGAQTLEGIREKYPRNGFINLGISMARSHHERWDGRGYPDGLVAEQIPLAARIMAVADVYDALRAKRCYKPALNHEESCAVILQGAGTQFAPDVVEAFREQQPAFREVWERSQS